MAKTKGQAGALRIRLGMIMAARRKQANLTQAQAADLAGMSQPKVSNIESASVVRINLGELAALGMLYGMTVEEIAEVQRFARSPYSGNGVWLDTAVNQPSRREVERAAVIKSFHLQAFDGLVQVPEYARLQMELFGHANVDDLVDARLVRQSVIWGREAAPWCTFVMDEACFHKTMGRPDVLIRQIEHLVKRAREDRGNQYFVVPFTAVSEAMVHDFTLYHIDSVVSATLATVEYGIGATLVEDGDTLQSLEQKFTQLLQATMPGSDTVPFMLDMIAHHRKHLE